MQWKPRGKFPHTKKWNWGNSVHRGRKDHQKRTGSETTDRRITLLRSWQILWIQPPILISQLHSTSHLHTSFPWLPHTYSPRGSVLWIESCERDPEWLATGKNEQLSESILPVGISSQPFIYCHWPIQTTIRTLSSPIKWTAKIAASFQEVSSVPNSKIRWKFKNKITWNHWVSISLEIVEARTYIRRNRADRTGL